MIAANDPLDAANDNPPQPNVRVYWQHLHVAGKPAQMIADIDVSELLEWYRQRGFNA